MKNILNGIPETIGITIEVITKLFCSAQKSFLHSNQDCTRAITQQLKHRPYKELHKNKLISQIEETS